MGCKRKRQCGEGEDMVIADVSACRKSSSSVSDLRMGYKALLLLLILCIQMVVGQESMIPPLWARESQLHQDALAGIVQGGIYESLAIPYDNQVPPTFNVEDENSVRMGLNIFKIKEIDIATSRMQLNAWIRLAWNDPRLAWDPTTPAYLNITQTTYNADTNPELTEIWVPDLELVNQDSAIVEAFHPKQAIVYPDGTVFWSRVGSIDALCAFSGIRRHPFDENECTVEFSGWSRSGLFANYSLMDQPLSWGGTGTARTTYQEYKLNQERSKAAVTTFFFDCCPGEPWPTLTFTFAFVRTTTALYLRTLTIPVMLLTFLASAVFWFDVRCGERLGYGITVLLAITAVEIIAEESLPTCPEWLWVEAFTVGSFVISVCCLVESCVVTHLYFKQRKEDLTEWIRVGESKKYEDGNSSNRENDHQSLDYYSCDNRGILSSLSRDDTNPAPVSPRNAKNSTDSTNDDDQSPTSLEDPTTKESEADDSSRTERLKMSVAMRFKEKLNKARAKSQEEKNKPTAAETWAAERNLDPTKFDLVRKIDAISFRVFISVYMSFVILMFATNPLWTDNYQVNI